MSIDHCIVTKYDLSSREKNIKKAFFNKKTSQAESTHEPKKVYSSNLYNNEIVDKLIDNFPKEIIKSPPIRNNNTHSIPLNLIYSQNKILEKNVDVLQETQRSIHDLLVFNMKSHKDQKDHKEKDNSFMLLNQIKQLVGPLYHNIDELKKSVNNIITNKNAENLNEKVQEMVTKHNDFKENSVKIHRNFEVIEKSKESVKDIQILKGIEELKKSIVQITNEMGKMETEFIENFKKIVEEKNVKKIISGIGTAVDSVNKINNNYQVKKVTSDTLDYVEYRNELLEITQKQTELLNEINSSKNKIILPNLKKPTEKINFSYKLDFEEEQMEIVNKNHNVNKAKPTIHNHKLSDTNFSRDENVFLNNLNNTKAELVKQNKERDIPKKEYTSNPVKQTNISDVIPTHIKQLSSINDCQIKQENIVDKMKQNVEKVRAYNKGEEIIKKKNQIKYQEINEGNKVTSHQNNIFSTKNSVVNHSTEVASAKKIKFQNEADNYEEEKKNDCSNTNVNVNINDNYKTINNCIDKDLKFAEKEIEESKSTNQNLRKNVTDVGVTPAEVKNHNIVHDLILKLCVDKIVSNLNKDKSIIKENKIEIVNTPFDYNKNEIKSATEEVLTNYIRNLIKGKQNIPKNIEEPKLNQPNLSSKLTEENEYRDKELVNCLNSLMTRFNVMEQNINLLYNKKEPADVLENKNFDMNDMITKITEKIKDNMHININLNQHPMEQPIKIKKAQQFELFHNSILIEGENKFEADEEEMSHPNNQHNQNQTNRSNYSHPFADVKQIDTDQLNNDIPLPYLMNLQDYDITSSSYQTESKRSPIKPERKITPQDDSISEGQHITDMSNLTSKHNINLSLLKQFNDKLKEQLDNISQNMNNIQSQRTEQEKDYFRIDTENNQGDISKSSSSISININKKLINLNNNEDLKTLNLYDSNEHNIFQMNFKGRSESDRQFDTQMTRRFNESSQKNFTDTAGSQFKFYKPNQFSNRSSDSQVKNNPHMFSFQNVLSNTNSNRAMSSSLSGNNDSRQLRLSRVSNEEIDTLVQRQMSLNEKLKRLSQTEGRKVDNNTIPENHSEISATIYYKEDEEIKKYKTDESSLNYSSAN